MPHMPVAVAATQMGACCQVCGVLPPVFTCGFCWGRQMLALPGAAAAPAQAPGGPQAFAPVVQAPKDASGNVLEQLLKEAGKTFVNTLARDAAQAII
jgi:hypothetical protein